MMPPTSFKKYSSITVNLFIPIGGFDEILSHWQEEKKVVFIYWFDRCVIAIKRRHKEDLQRQWRWRSVFEDWSANHFKGVSALRAWSSNDLRSPHRPLSQLRKLADRLRNWMFYHAECIYVGRKGNDRRNGMEWIDKQKSNQSKCQQL